MAYNQKNNPFLKKTKNSEDTKVNNTNDIELAKRLNKLRFDMGHIYPITSEEEIRKDDKYNLDYFQKNPDLIEQNVQTKLDNTAQSEEERAELYRDDVTGAGHDHHGNLDPKYIGDPDAIKMNSIWSTKGSNEHIYEKDLQFIKTARNAGGEVFNKIMSMPEEDIVNLEKDIIATAQPFRGKNLGKNTASTLKELAKLDLSRFKPYLKKSKLKVDDISKVITSQLNNLPDLNKDGTPDAFEGIKGKIVKKSIDYLVSSKLDQLR